jgi:hypothetical protein
MPTKLKDTLEKVRKIDNRSNSDLLKEFYEYLRSVRTSERYQTDVLKVLVKFSEFVNDDFVSIQKKQQVIAFLNTKIKSKQGLTQHEHLMSNFKVMILIKIF